MYVGIHNQFECEKSMYMIEIRAVLFGIIHLTIVEIVGLLEGLGRKEEVIMKRPFMKGTARMIAFDVIDQVNRLSYKFLRNRWTRKCSMFRAIAEINLLKQTIKHLTERIETIEDIYNL